MRISDWSSDVCSSDLTGVTRQTVIDRMKRIGEMFGIRRSRRRQGPAVDGFLRPACGLVPVTTPASIGTAGVGFQQRARQTETVITTGIDTHVGDGRHVAVHALGAVTARFVLTMRRRVENDRPMALRAGRVARQLELEAETGRAPV